jgi:3-deoxy-D-manno-octulosonate 8-phosphate phosphatase KdsC-like HAD superfamily phosphatase
VAVMIGPADGHVESVREAADYVTEEPGGGGAVGGLIRYLLKDMGLWDQAMERYR